MPRFESTRGAVAATDVLIAGDVLRVVHGGLPELRSRDAADGLTELRARYEPYRTFLNDPPHGNLLVNACLLYPAAQPDSAGRHFLASRFGYAPFAGTALMACAAVLADENRVGPEDLREPLRFETAKGVARVKLSVDAPELGTAAWVAPMPRVLLAERVFEDPKRGKSNVSIVSCGLPYIVVEDSELAVSIDDISQVEQAAMSLSKAVGEERPVAEFGAEGEHPRYLVMVMNSKGKDDVSVVWVSDRGESARSAGGTGALAVLAALQARGLRRSGRTVTIRAPGGSFQCRIDDNSAVVTATTRLVARHEFLTPPL